MCNVIPMGYRSLSIFGSNVLNIVEIATKPHYAMTAATWTTVNLLQRPATFSDKHYSVRTQASKQYKPTKDRTSATEVASCRVAGVRRP